MITSKDETTRFRAAMRPESRGAIPPGIERVVLNLILPVVARKARIEIFYVKTDIAGNFRKLFRSQTVVGRRDFVNFIYERPEFFVAPQFRRALRCLGLIRRLGVKLGNREMTIDPRHLIAIGSHDLMHRRMERLTEGALQIGELDDLNRRVWITEYMVGLGNRFHVVRRRRLLFGCRIRQIRRLILHFLSGVIKQGNGYHDAGNHDARRKKIIPLWFLFIHWIGNSLTVLKS